MKLKLSQFAKKKWNEVKPLNQCVFQKYSRDSFPFLNRHAGCHYRVSQTRGEYTRWGRLERNFSWEPLRKCDQVSTRKQHGCISHRTQHAARQHNQGCLVRARLQHTTRYVSIQVRYIVQMYLCARICTSSSRDVARESSCDLQIASIWIMLCASAQDSACPNLYTCRECDLQRSIITLKFSQEIPRDVTKNLNCDLQVTASKAPPSLSLFVHLFVRISCFLSLLTFVLACACVMWRNREEVVTNSDRWSRATCWQVAMEEIQILATCQNTALLHRCMWNDHPSTATRHANTHTHAHVHTHGIISCQSLSSFWQEIFWSRSRMFREVHGGPSCDL